MKFIFVQHQRVLAALVAGMNGMSRILKPAGLGQQIAQFIHSCTYNANHNNMPPDMKQGEFVIINGKIIKIPPPPTTCCMSGCANCVYIAYAEEITRIFRDGGCTAKEIVLNNIEDPNMRAFLSMELRNAENKRKK